MNPILCILPHCCQIHLHLPLQPRLLARLGSHSSLFNFPAPNSQIITKKLPPPKMCTDHPISDLRLTECLASSSSPAPSPSQKPHEEGSDALSSSSRTTPSGSSTEEDYVEGEGEEDPYADMPSLQHHYAGEATDERPCEHNLWTRSRRRRVIPGTRLRCVVCKSLWITILDHHKKCSLFYSGACDGSCGNPHILARGSVPKDINDESKIQEITGRPLRAVLHDKPKMKARSKMKVRGQAEKAA